MNQEQKEFCEVHKLTEEQFFGSEEIKRDLYLNGLTSIPQGFNPTMGGSLYLQAGRNLYLQNLTSTPHNFNPNVGGRLFLGKPTSLQSSSDIDSNLNNTKNKMNKEQQDFCEAHNLTEEQFFGRENIEGSLWLGNLTSIPQGFNPTVGATLYLNALTSIPLGFNPTVGENLCLNSLTSIPQGFNPTVGWDLFLGKPTQRSHIESKTAGDTSSGVYNNRAELLGWICPLCGKGNNPNSSSCSCVS